ncbi:MAG: hypothetical protein HY608_11010 [Planctomycetes bacterium]|nr:hypothetical protein [Planctomycetota bacterium]
MRAAGPVLMLLVLASAAAQEPSLAEWIARLGDDDFAVRENASAHLRETGPSSVDALQDAWERTRDPEVQARIHALVTGWRRLPDARQERSLQRLPALLTSASPDAFQEGLAILEGAPESEFVFGILVDLFVNTSERGWGARTKVAPSTVVPMGTTTDQWRIIQTNEGSRVCWVFRSLSERTFRNGYAGPFASRPCRMYSRVDGVRPIDQHEGPGWIRELHRRLAQSHIQWFEPGARREFPFPPGASYDRVGIWETGWETPAEESGLDCVFRLHARHEGEDPVMRDELHFRPSVQSTVRVFCVDRGANRVDDLGIQCADLHVVPPGSELELTLVLSNRGTRARPCPMIGPDLSPAWYVILDNKGGVADWGSLYARGGGDSVEALEPDATFDSITLAAGEETTVRCRRTFRHGRYRPGRYEMIVGMFLQGLRFDGSLEGPDAVQIWSDPVPFEIPAN